MSLHRSTGKEDLSNFFYILAKKFDFKGLEPDTPSVIQ